MLVYQRVTNKNDGFSMGLYEGMRAKQLTIIAAGLPELRGGRWGRQLSWLTLLKKWRSVALKKKHQPNPLPNQWEFQDPKMEVLYHIRPYFVGIFPLTKRDLPIKWCLPNEPMSPCIWNKKWLSILDGKVSARMNWLSWKARRALWIGRLFSAPTTPFRKVNLNHQFLEGSPNWGKIHWWIISYFPDTDCRTQGVKRTRLWGGFGEEDTMGQLELGEIPQVRWVALEVVAHIAGRALMLQYQNNQRCSLMFLHVSFADPF